jgi:hypothetical protein
VNAHHFKTVPGCKTDVKDCQWLQQLHESVSSQRPTGGVRHLLCMEETSQIFFPSALFIERNERILTYSKRLTFAIAFCIS